MEHVKIKLQITCIYLIQSFFKNKRCSKTSLPASFSAWFLRKNISLVLFFYLTKFQYLVAFTSWDIGQYVYCNSLLNRSWRNKFSNEPYLSNQAVFSRWAKSQDKNLNILRTKRPFLSEKIVVEDVLWSFYEIFGKFHLDAKSSWHNSSQDFKCRTVNYQIKRMRSYWFISPYLQ